MGSPDLALGPFCQANWLKAKGGDPPQFIFEVPLYSDGWVTGQETGDGLNLGPYQFLNTVPSDRSFGSARAAVVLRYADHFDPDADLPKMDKTDSARFHGGYLDDELAALLSLCLGVRFWPSEVTRWIDPPPRSPIGKPRAEPQHSVPTLTIRSRWPVIPSILGPAALGEALPIESLPDIRPELANALVRSARAYQQALWVADSDSSLAWVFLVSAVETAAAQWATDDRDSATVLEEQKPKFTETLKAAHGHFEEE